MKNYRSYNPLLQTSSFQMLWYVDLLRRATSLLQAKSLLKVKSPPSHLTGLGRGWERERKSKYAHHHAVLLEFLTQRHFLFFQLLCLKRKMRLLHLTSLLQRRDLWWWTVLYMTLQTARTNHQSRRTWLWWWTSQGGIKVMSSCVSSWSPVSSDTLLTYTRPLTILWYLLSGFSFLSPLVVLLDNVPFMHIVFLQVVSLFAPAWAWLWVTWQISPLQPIKRLCRAETPPPVSVARGAAWAWSAIRSRRSARKSRLCI